MNGMVKCDPLRKLRILGGQVEKIKIDVRSFMETKDKELGKLQSQIKEVCESLGDEEPASSSAQDSALKRSYPFDGETPAAKKPANSRTPFSLQESRTPTPVIDPLPRHVSQTPASSSNDLNKNSMGFQVADGMTEVFTDGACSNNGQAGARAGVGVWWGEGHPLNVSQRVAGEKQTNNTAEIQAASLAISQAIGAGVEKLRVHTDSQFLINCVTKWMVKWKQTGWRTGSGQEVKNKEDLLQLDSLLSGGRTQVEWHHVKGHSNVRGNVEADRLAVKGAAM